MNMYGRELTRAEEDRLFVSRAGCRRGINHDKGVVKWIKIIIGPNGPYKNNEIVGDTIRYCYSNAVSDMDAMESAYKSKLLFRVKIIGPCSRSFDFGEVVIHSLLDDSESGNELQRMTAVKRYVLKRVQKSSPVTTQVDSSSPVSEETDSTVSKEDGARAAPGGGDDLLPSSKRQRVLKKYDDDPNVRSFLERKHMRVMDALNIEWAYEKVTVHDVFGDGSKENYFPDFYLKKEKMYVEIKPQYPYDIQIQKAIGFCTHLECDLALLYNTEFCCPFDPRPPQDRDHSEWYQHSPGVRGMMFKWNPTTEKVDILHDACYMVTDDGSKQIPPVATIGVRDGPMDMRPYHPFVLEAYGEA